MRLSGLRCFGSRWTPVVARRCALLLSAALCGPLHAAQDDAAGPSSIRINERVTHYAIAAGSIEDLREQLRHGVPSPGDHGHTSSDVGIRYELDMSAAGCRLRNLEVRLDIVVTLPEWRPRRQVSAAEWRRWERALAALEDHEATHRANARAAAEEARVRIQAIGPRPDCRSVRNTASRLLRRTMLKYEFRDRRYDARTRNGAEEGALL